jgi:hypothetical protein
VLMLRARDLEDSIRLLESASRDPREISLRLTRSATGFPEYRLTIYQMYIDRLARRDRNSTFLEGGSAAIDPRSLESAAENDATRTVEEGVEDRPEGGGEHTSRDG